MQRSPYRVYRLPHTSKPATDCVTLAGARAYAAAQKRGGDIFDATGWVEAWRAGALIGFMDGGRWRSADAEIAERLASSR
jgi:hypothetical protein